MSIPNYVDVEGDIRNISIGKNVLFEKGAVLSVKYGGTIHIGDNCEIRRGVIVASYGGDIVIGNHCSMNPYCILYGHGGVNIGNYVRIAAQTVIIPSNHGIKDLDLPFLYQKPTMKGITIEDNVWIGAGVKILDGIKIQEGSVVAAGSVVNKDVEKNSIVGGIPAKLIKKRNLE